MIRVQLLIGGKKYEATNDLVNWEDVEISIRKDFGGVYMRRLAIHLSLPVILICSWRTSS